MAGWYVRRGEQVIGPIEVDKLKESVAAGKLLPTDQLSKDAAGPWTTASKTKLFVTEQISPPAPAAPPRSAIVPQAERLPIVAEPEPQPESQSKIAPVVRISQTVISKVAGGTVATWSAFTRTLSTRAQRKHEIKLAKIQAEANRPPVPQQTNHPRPAPQQLQQPVVFAPQIVQSTVVKVVNKNGGGCGCSGCGLLILLVIIALVAAAIYSGTKPAP